MMSENSNERGEKKRELRRMSIGSRHNYHQLPKHSELLELAVELAGESDVNLKDRLIQVWSLGTTET